MAVQEDRAAKIKEDLSAQRKELNDKLCEQFERRLDITERDEQQKEEIKKKKTVQEITPMTEAMLVRLISLVEIITFNLQAVALVHICISSV